VDELKRVSNPCKIPFFAALVATTLGLGLEGCPTRPKASYPPLVERPVSGQTREQAPAQPHEGRPYDIVSDESLLTLLVFRGGPLAKAGHNHVIASHALRGTVYVPADPGRATFDVHLPVAELTVDEAVLRAKENEADFPPDVPDSAKEGTRKNMLGAALLDAEHHPDIDLRSSGLEPSGPQWIAHVKVTVRDHDSTIAMPVRYEPQGDEVVVSGEFPLKQSDLGLTPFSALLGALQVVDEMRVRFHIVAHAARN
jgi:polyisoprenoid-binding protein YceI